MTRAIQSLKLVLYFTLVANLVGFYIFEQSHVYRLVMIGAVIWVWVMTFLRNQFEPLIAITLYLAFYNLFNLYYAVSFPLWAVALIAAFIACGFFLSTVTLGLTPSSRHTVLYGILVGLASAEIFISLSVWATAYTSLSLLAVIINYILWRLIVAHLKQELSARLSIAYLTFTALVILLILLSTPWYDTIKE